MQNPILHLQAGRRRLREGRPCSVAQEVRGTGQAWRCSAARPGSSGAAGSKDCGAEAGGHSRWGRENRLAPQGPVRRLRPAGESQELAWTRGGGLGGRHVRSHTLGRQRPSPVPAHLSQTHSLPLSQNIQPASVTQGLQTFGVNTVQAFWARPLRGPWET